MTRFNLVVLLVFSSGCSGGEFSTFSRAELDAADAATGGAVSSTGGAPSTGGVIGSGGDVGTGGAPEVDAGETPPDAPPTSTGGAPSTGGATNTGGASVVDACAFVTHDNGLGQTWQDCVPLYTYNEEQAMRACEASDATKCLVLEACGTGLFEVRGYRDADTGGRWGYEGAIAGYVGTGTSGELCFGANDPANHKWN